MSYIPHMFVLTAGLTIGSFLNVLIYRLPRGKQFLVGRSSCPNCGNTIRWYHNIPVLSYLWLCGKCAYCRKPISFRYPLVELLNGVGYLYFFWEHGWSVDFGIFAFLTSTLIVIFFIDLDHQLIPDSITLPGIIVGVGVSVIPGGTSPVQSLIGLLVGGGALYLIALLGDWLFRKDSMGGGDVKMAAMLGAFLGWQKVLFIFLASAAIGLVVSVIIMSFSKKLRQTRVVPFGPFIALAAVAAIVWGDVLIDFYIHNFLGLN